MPLSQKGIAVVHRSLAQSVDSVQAQVQERNRGIYWLCSPSSLPVRCRPSGPQTPCSVQKQQGMNKSGWSLNEKARAVRGDEPVNVRVRAGQRCGPGRWRGFRRDEVLHRQPSGQRRAIHALAAHTVLQIIFPYDRIYPGTRSTAARSPTLTLCQSNIRTCATSSARLTPQYAQLPLAPEYAQLTSPKGHCVLEMPSGTGKTVSLLSLIVSYQQVRAPPAHAPSLFLIPV